MNEIEENIMNKLNDLLTNDLEAINVSIFGNSASKNIQIMIESDMGVSIDNCAEVSKLARNIITMEKFIEDDYNIEVSSPGIERPLFNVAHYKRFLGYDVRIKMFRSIEGRRNFTGVIGSISDKMNTVELITELGSISLDLDLIEKANLVANI